MSGVLSEAARKEFEDMLVESSKLLYNTPYFSNMGEDKDGSITTDTNSHLKKDYWTLAGYFNTILKAKKSDGTPKITRNIDITAGAKIFCMVATSHATKFEAAKLKLEPSVTNLKSIAERIDKLWTEIRLTYDGIRQPLNRIVTGVFEVNIPDKDKEKIPPFREKVHPYVKYGEDQGVTLGPTPMLSIGHVALLPEHDGGTHTLDFYAAANGDTELGEPSYESDVRYNIT